MKLAVVILAAGQGKRMKSDLPKVLQPLAGVPLLGHVVSRARTLQPSSIHVVFGHGGEAVRATIKDADLRWALQAQQLGTGHAVMQAMPDVADDELVLVLYGDVPLIDTGTLRQLIASADASSMSLLTVMLDNPTGYGRIVRNAQGDIQKIVEQKDASATELALREGNSGIMAVPAKLLRQWLGKLRNSNAQGEYYLTDVIAMAVADRVKVLVDDYRNLPAKKYDKITCLEMAEHVGIKNFQKFLLQVRSMLKDDGIFYLQIAGLRRSWQFEDLVWGLFMAKYIFPGADASLPPAAMLKPAEEVGWETFSVENVSQHYGWTIRRWHDNWLSNKADVIAAYGERWFRLWHIFLAWSTKIADQGNASCYQVVFNKNIDAFDRTQHILDRGVIHGVRTNGIEAPRPVAVAGNGNGATIGSSPSDRQTGPACPRPALVPGPTRRHSARRQAPRSRSAARASRNASARRPPAARRSARPPGPSP